MVLERVVLLVSLFVLGVWAQSDIAQCKSGYEWNRNSLGQDPCTVGSMLDASCRGFVVYTYPPVNSSQYYLPPSGNRSGDLACDCNSVMYNFYMACASCQGGGIYSWGSWIFACENVYIGEYPIDIAQGTAIPHWALYNVTWLANQTYDEATMMRIGRDPEELPTKINVTTVVTGTGSLGMTTLSPSSTKSLTDQPSPTDNNQPSSTDNSSNNTKGGTNVGAIVGGVVGSVVPLTILAVVGVLYVRYRRQHQAQQQMWIPEGLDPHRQYLPWMYLYNPSDPSTFPPPNQSAFLSPNLSRFPPPNPPTFSPLIPPALPPMSPATYTTPISSIHGTRLSVVER